MRFKLDENLGRRTRQVFVDAGNDVRTIRDEGLQGRTDETIYEVCRVERRCLVTLDLDFSNAVRFPPVPTAGIVVLRLGQRFTLELLAGLADAVVRMVAVRPVEGKLWIVEPGRIRIHESADGDQG